MRRVAVWVGICAVLLSGAMVPALAQISIANDGDQIDIVLRDADINAVLAALFNTTKQQFRVEAGVNGHVTSLQTRGKFEDVLNAVLGDKISYTKTPQGDGVYLYRIVGRPGAAPAAGAGGTTPGAGAGAFPTMAPPSSNVTPPAVSAAGDDSSSKASSSGDAASFTSLSFETGSKDTKSADGKTTTSSASGESKIRLIRVSNIDLSLLCQALGFGQAIDLFGTSLQGGTSGMSGTGYNTMGTNGTTGMNGMSNGMTGMNGMSNGMSNGMTSMNGMSNGMTNTGTMNTGTTNGYGTTMLH